MVWEHPDDSLNPLIQRFLDSGRVIVTKIGPWEELRPPAPAQGKARINLLTPSGLHFGEGPTNVLASDKLCGPVIVSALGLMQELIKKAQINQGKQ